METVTRRHLIQASSAGIAAAAQRSTSAQESTSSVIPSSVIAAHDKGVDDLLAKQVTDPSSKYMGGVPDANGLYFPGTTAGIADHLTAAFVTKGSKHHQSGLLLDRIGKALEFSGVGARDHVDRFLKAMAG